MKGIILAGGNGTRLFPLTSVISKQLLPVYDRPMIFYPLNTLISAGITEILVIVSPEYSGHFLNLLGSMFRKYGVSITFAVQKSPRGLAEAFILAEDFMDEKPVTLILGDNIFEDDFTESIQSFEKGARVFAKEVSDPERFGVVEFDAGGKVLSIEEKPKQPKSNYAIPGLYIFDNEVCSVAKGLAPSERGELEITDLQRHYLDKSMLDVRTFTGGFFDAGTFDSLLEVSNYVKDKNFRDHCHPMINEAIKEFSVELKKIVSMKI